MAFTARNFFPSSAILLATRKRAGLYGACSKYRFTRAARIRFHFSPVRNKKRNGCPRNTTKRAPPHVESIDFPIRDIVSFSLPAKQMPPKRAIINLMQWRKLWPLPFMKTSASDNFFPPSPPPLPSCAKIERGNSADKGLLPHYRHISPLGHNWGRPRRRDLRGHGLHASARH